MSRSVGHESADPSYPLPCPFSSFREWASSISCQRDARLIQTQTWWIDRGRHGLACAGTVYRKSCQLDRTMNLWIPFDIYLFPRVDWGVYCRWDAEFRPDLIKTGWVVRRKHRQGYTGRFYRKLGQGQQDHCKQWIYRLLLHFEILRGWIWGTREFDVYVIRGMPKWIGTRRHALRCVRFTVIHVKGGVGRQWFCRLLLPFIFLRGWMGISPVDEPGVGPGWCRHGGLIADSCTNIPVPWETEHYRHLCGNLTCLQPFLLNLTRHLCRNLTCLNLTCHLVCSASNQPVRMGLFDSLADTRD